MDKPSAERLRDKVNLMLEEARLLPDQYRPRGVNWGDLSVRDICGEISYLHDGGVEIFVDIEEAAPECSEWFTKKLNEPGIVVRCSW